MSKATTCQASASRVGAESGTSSAEMLISLMYIVKQFTGWFDEDREEFRVFRKAYDMDRADQNTTKNTAFREDILSIAQAADSFTLDA